MKSDAIAFGVAGILFGLIAGWVIGSQQTQLRQPAPAPQAAAAVTAQTQPASAPPPPPLDETKVNAFKAVAERDPKNAEARVQLGNLYFDSEKYQDAIKWYGEAYALEPNDANVSTDLGISYYYMSQPDEALQQFDKSLKIDPKHAKTLLNIGIVRAFGKQDLDGALQAWQQLVQVSPNSPEGQAAQKALDSLKGAHPGAAGGQPPGA